MQTRGQVLKYHDGREKEFKVYDVPEPTTIAEPGQFEGETLATPYYFDLAMNGCSDESGDGWDAFKLDAEDKALFPWLAESDWFVLSYSEQGFVYGNDCTQAAIDKFVAEESAKEESDDA